MFTFAQTLAACAIAAVSLSSFAAGKVEVTYINPDRFADLGYDQTDREKVLRSFDEHFVKMGQRLPDGQTLLLQVGDIDLAGNLDFSMMRGTQPIRVFAGNGDGPRLRLFWQLMSGTTTLKQGEADLSNPKYIENRRQTYLGNPELRYERRMLDQWFDKEVLGQ